MEDNNRGGLLGFIVVTAIGAVAASAAWEGGKDLYSWAKGKVTAMVTKSNENNKQEVKL